ncbi:hypothetical protein [Actinoplanes auranticolor]|uniref:Uncharacterized protein n=1 Tax=Actinoplanes auranticolor TaxID=47988 RepID=A0A919SVY7_9ACTN|nr:hypothetical protein [Actinoplanes auranticolor]GIM78053.1 hypothetical protein Aau02nite_79010 [Actinoplanes auranticolor]
MSNDEAKQTGATPQYVNLAPKPMTPDIVLLLRATPEPDKSEIMRNLSDFGWYKIVLSWMIDCETPAELEEFHKSLFPKIRAMGLSEWYTAHWMETYYGMWAWFLGGHS